METPLGLDPIAACQDFPDILTIATCAQCWIQNPGSIILDHVSIDRRLGISLRQRGPGQVGFPFIERKQLKRLGASYENCVERRELEDLLIQYRGLSGRSP